MSNPFSTTFSKAPSDTYIQTKEEIEIIEEFTSPKPSESVFKITGVRGSGKTVILSKVEEKLKTTHSDEWLVYDINPTRDILSQLAAYMKKDGLLDFGGKLKTVNVSASVGPLSAGASFAPQGDSLSDIGPMIDRMLENAKKRNKRVLIAVDEMSKNDEVIKFVAEFGRWIRGDLPVFLVCTGLYENMMELSMVKNLTFFLRATSIKSEPLNFIQMSSVYKKELNVTLDLAKEMAQTTKGYAYAFQILGKMYFSKRKEDEYPDVVEQMKTELFSYSYEKIYEEMSYGDRRFVSVLKEARPYSREEIVTELGESASSYSVYRDRLMKRGIIRQSSYGYLEMSLPFFEEYLRDYRC